MKSKWPGLIIRVNIRWITGQALKLHDANSKFGLASASSSCITFDVISKKKVSTEQIVHISPGFIFLRSN